MTCQLISRNDTDNSITIWLDGKQYEYFLASPASLHTAEYLLKHWPMKGLNYMKKRSTTVRKLEQ